MFFAHASKTTTFHNKFMKNVAVLKSLPTFTSLAHLQSKTLIVSINLFITKKWVNRPLNLILSESSQFFCANRPVRFFARIVPVESSQGGTGFCAKRPVTSKYGYGKMPPKKAYVLVLEIYLEKQLRDMVFV